MTRGPYKINLMIASSSWATRFAFKKAALSPGRWFILFFASFSSFLNSSFFFGPRLMDPKLEAEIEFLRAWPYLDEELGKNSVKTPMLVALKKLMTRSSKKNR